MLICALKIANNRIFVRLILIKLVKVVDALILFEKSLDLVFVLDQVLVFPHSLLAWLRMFNVRAFIVIIVIAVLLLCFIILRHHVLLLIRLILRVSFSLQPILISSRLLFFNIINLILELPDFAKLGQLALASSETKKALLNWPSILDNRVNQVVNFSRLSSLSRSIVLLLLPL